MNLQPSSLFLSPPSGISPGGMSHKNVVTSVSSVRFHGKRKAGGGGGGIKERKEGYYRAILRGKASPRFRRVLLLESARETGS